MMPCPYDGLSDDTIECLRFLYEHKWELYDDSPITDRSSEEIA